MGTLQKSQKCHEKSISTRYFAKNTDFQLLNGFDHVYEAIRAGSWKIVIFEPKIIRIDENHQKWTHFLPNHIVLVFKTVFKTAIFRKNLRWGPYKNRKNITKNRSARGTSRKTLISSFWTASITYTRRFGPEAEKSWFLNRKSSGSMKIIKSEHVFCRITSC